MNEAPGFVNEKEAQQVETYIVQLQQLWPREWGPFEASQVRIDTYSCIFVAAYVVPWSLTM